MVINVPFDEPTGCPTKHLPTIISLVSYLVGVGAVALGAGQGARQAEVGQLEQPVGCNQAVVGLDVPAR